ncbi:AMP-binding protein [Alicyclobacillus sp. ALC3]|uniref:AMP-binding protein n=1 Tax=Alicyclobacillus sp. ALC3 TaxID=2796143 RepID=UPI002378F4DA|nr:AMP-binding protein [Alicyclobacillus sp. ALC3]WDL98002.1 AMP-binding protein [Alicyclobacillus sp. ALC3]
MKLQTILTDSYKARYMNDWPHRTIVSVLKQRAKEIPDKVAIIDRNSSYTYREFEEVVDRVALALQAYGVGAGDVVSFQLPNWNEFLILHFATTRIGAISNPLIPIYRDREISYMVREAESKVLVIPDVFRGFDYTEMISRLRPNWPALQHVFVIGEHVPEGFEAFSKLTDEPWETRGSITALDDIVLDPNDVTEIVFTSGTTGMPKGVMHTHNTLGTTNDIMVERLGLTSDDVIFMASTFAHQTGFLYGVRMPIELGATAIFQDVWNPHRLVDHIEQDKVTFTMAATPFLYDLVQLEGLKDRDLSSLKYFVSAGAPIPRPLVREAYEKLPCRILSGWGQSENGLVTVTMPGDSIDKLTSTDGCPLGHLKVKTVDESQALVAPDTEGDLWVAGATVFVGYLKNHEYTVSQFVDEWFITGDRATIDSDGYVRITGRQKDTIIRGGENVPVSYIENLLHEHPDVAVAQLVAMPDARLQERACAFVSMKPGREPLTMASMTAFLNQKGVTRQYWPERIEIVEEFPRTASGKVQKFRLRELIAAKLQTD